MKKPKLAAWAEDLCYYAAVGLFIWFAATAFQWGFRVIYM